MVKQYPDILTFTPVGNSYQDDNGVIMPGNPQQPVHQKCRYEVSTQARQITTSDGKTIFLTGTIFMPKNAIHIPAGTSIEIEGVIKATVIQSQKTQLNKVLYL